MPPNVLDIWVVSRIHKLINHLTFGQESLAGSNAITTSEGGRTAENDDKDIYIKLIRKLAKVKKVPIYHEKKARIN